MRFCNADNDLNNSWISREGKMLVDMLVWLGVVMAAFIAWSLYVTAEKLPEDKDPPRNRDDLS